MIYESRIVRLSIACISVIGLIILAFLVTGFVDMLPLPQEGRLLLLVSGTGLLSPAVVWLISRGVKRIFQDLYAYYAIETVPTMAYWHWQETLALFTAATRLALCAPSLCLLCYDEESGLYRLCPEGDPSKSEVLVAAQELAKRFPPLPGHGYAWSSYAPWLQILSHHAQQRPLFAQEVMQLLENKTSLPRMVQYRERQDLLLVPLKGELQDRLLGVLVLGARRDPYAGADFEKLTALTARLLPSLSIHLVEERHRRQERLISKLLLKLPPPLSMVDDLEEVASWYAQTISLAMNCRAEIWYWRRGQKVHVIKGDGPPCPLPDAPRTTYHPWPARDMQQETDEAPFPYALIVASETQQKVLLSLAFASPHQFVLERHVLEIFFRHMSIHISNIAYLQELRTLYQQQQEADYSYQKFAQKLDPLVHALRHDAEFLYTAQSEEAYDEYFHTLSRRSEEIEKHIERYLREIDQKRI